MYTYSMAAWTPPRYAIFEPYITGYYRIPQKSLKVQKFHGNGQITRLGSKFCIPWRTVVPSYCVHNCTAISTYKWSVLTNVLAPAAITLVWGILWVFPCVFTYTWSVCLFCLCCVFGVFSPVCFEFSCKYRCKRLPWKTRVQNDLLYVKQEVTHSLT